MIHLDLFSGIGGFSYAADQVWDDVEHIFVEVDPFCQQVLKKHWPESEVIGDIKNLTDTKFKGLERSGQQESTGQRGQPSGVGGREKPFLLTGGFPCQPFSAAGVRRGTSDERYLWPQMFRVIQLAKPTWVIAENVRGLLTWEQGVVFEQVCTDLESEGYEVQPFIIPAVAVNAPHRRDRIWWVATKPNSQRERTGRGEIQEADGKVPQRHNDAQSSHTGEGGSTSDPEHTRQHGSENRKSLAQGGHSNSKGQEESKQPERPDSLRQTTTDPRRTSRRTRDSQRRESYTSQRPPQAKENQRYDWSKDWLEVATEFCSVDDGLSVELGEFKLSKSKHRAEQLKAYGNAIVPQVAIEIMKGIKYADQPS